jgi:histidyl-tRNA synthetase
LRQGFFVASWPVFGPGYNSPFNFQHDLEVDLTTIRRVAGVQDILPEDRRYWDLVVQTIHDLTRRYGFERVDIPIIEYSELFTRGVGTASDFFVNKEMYTIDEEGDRSITFRPEFTAGFVRAYLENGMSSWPQPVKIYTIGPAFRRERPQAGRFRQHSQFNPEILGQDDPAADAEIMMLTANLHRELGYKELGFQVNSTGCPECRPEYVARLKEYLEQHLDALADIDRERLRRNPLRVLDSKERGMDELLADAPHIVDFLCEDCATHFSELLGYLDALQQSYTVNFRLVRGIDYYTKTVFELWDRAIGAQASLGGGGRYDGLAEAIGGPPTPGVGVGIGIDRLVIGLKKQGIEAPQPQVPRVMIAHFGGETKTAAVQLTFALRAAGIGTRLAFARGRRSLKSQLREANRQSAAFAVIIGESELAQDVVTVRDMSSGEQITVASEALPTWLTARSLT